MSAAAEHERALGASYLRQQAQRFARLARDCPHLPTSHELEAIGVELMEKAAEMDEWFAIRPADTTGSR